MRVKSVVLIALLIIFCVTSEVRALTLDGSQDSVNVAPYVEYLIPDETLSVTEVMARKGDFIPHGGDAINFGFLQHDLWLRLRFQQGNEPGAEFRQYLLLSKIHIRQLDYFHFVDGQLVRERHTGTDRFYATRDVDAPQFIFRLDKRVGDNELVLRLRTSSPLHTDLSISNAPNILKVGTDHQFLYGMILGFFALAILLSGTLAYTTRQRSIIYGFLLMCSAFAFSLTNSGFGFSNLWPETPGLNPFVSRLSLGFCFGMTGLFATEFLELKRIAPRLALATRLSSIFLICTMIFPVFSFAPVFALAITFLVPILTLISACYATSKKASGAKLLLVGFLLYIACVVTSSLASFGVLPNEFEYAYLLDIGMIMMAIILAYGLALKINERSLAAAVSTEGVKAKSLFFAIMSHEIRTPINGVLGMLNLLEKQNLNEEQGKLARYAKSSAQTLLSLINDILDLSKIEAGKLDLEPITFDVVDLLDEVTNSFAQLETNRHIEMILDTHHIQQRYIVSDSGRLRQILNNLLSNALKFTSEGEVEIHAQIVQNTLDPELLISVRDTGIGISDQQLPRLFDNFTQADESTTRKYGGTGLGLSIAKQLCKLLGGNLSATSTPGIGSIFTFSIQIELASTQPLKPKPAIQGKKALIFDPCPAAMRVSKNYLKAWGAEVHSTPVEQKFFSILSREFFDIVIYCGSKALPEDMIQPHQLILAQPVSDYHARQLSKPISETALVRSLTKLEEVSETNVIATVRPKPYKLLLVEDNFINTEVALGILEDCGYHQIETAENGQEAIDLLKQEQFDLVLMDCQMPILDGYEATRWIRAGKAGEQSKVPIIAMTANAMQGDREKCLAVGMDDYLSKPIDPDKLTKTLQQWLTN
tara:strand:+ start:730 stop:3357 length:2628 start_codon:yes stop_codon:yes gene_type:complete